MKISVIGLGLSYDDLTENHLSVISKADVLAGGERHLSYFPEFSGRKIRITKDLKELGRKLEKMMKAGLSIVVLASGDPLFYGIGTYLSGHLGKDNVDIFPNISSVAAGFSRIRESWHDAKVISLHGRIFENRLANEFRVNDKLAVLTDRKNTPSGLYEFLAEKGLNDFSIRILERLGQKAESIHRFAPGESVKGDFCEPNLMILIREPSEKEKIEKYPGMPDHLYRHERGMITKPEVRVVTLSKLMLKSDSVMWDLGAGSGSVSIESSFYIDTGRIYAVEKNESRVGDIRENRKRFRVPNLEVFQGVLPGAMDSLPDPDRIFVGGGGEDLVPIIDKGADRLMPGGVIVINTVLIKNMADSLDKLERLGFKTEIIQMQINYGHGMPWNRMLKCRNPIWIIRGLKQ